MADAQPSSALARAIAEEQSFVETAYQALDEKREYYSEQLRSVRAQGAFGSPGQRSERDSFAAHYEDNLLRLRNVENRLVLGRLDSTDSTMHIGRILLRDDDQKIILLDWRAPQAKPFYQATAAQPGNVIRRRHIQTRFREVTGVEDELLAETKATELNLTGEGALMAAMSQARDGKMGDIVATIQAEQDQIIRSEAEGILVVQGGPGTGKTAVALHRAAFLLYTHRQKFARSGVLVVGPSPVFLRYIDQVLPSLGESDVVSTTIDGLVPGVVASATEEADVAEIKGRLAWSAIAKRAVRAILQKPLLNAVKIQIESTTVTLRPEDVESAQRRARRTGKLHNQARDVYAKQLVEVLGRRLADARDLDFEANEDWILDDVAGSRDARREINLHWLPSSPVQLLERIYHWPELLDRVAGHEVSRADRAKLRREKGAGMTRADIAILDELADHLGPFTSDFERQQAAARAAERQELNSYVAKTMAEMNLGSGIVNSEMMADRLSEDTSGSTLADRAAADRLWTYGHVVVDEAQELSPMQWRMIARRNPSRSMTLVGDLDQRPAGAPDGGWKAALGPLADNHRVAELTISYRTPATVMDRATEIMEKVGHPVRPARSARDLEDSYRIKKVGLMGGVAPTDAAIATVVGEIVDACADLDVEYGENRGSVALITPARDHEVWAAALSKAPELQGWTLDERGDDVTSRIHVLTPRTAKGLEYDIVVMASPDQILAEGPGDLYVAMTRPTRRLIVAT